MKTKAISSIFVLFAIAAGMASMAPAAFATVEIGAVEGSGFGQDCAVMNGGAGCYTPMIATVDVGGVVTMTNNDPTGSPHSFTAGTIDGFAQAPSGEFDSGIIMADDFIEWTPTEAGTVPYYCMLHVWMIGEIIVQEAAAEEAHDDTEMSHDDAEGAHDDTEMSHDDAEGAHDDAAMKMPDVHLTTADGTMHIHIDAETPEAGSMGYLSIAFKDANHNLAEHVNYDIMVMQDGESVYEEMGGHVHNGMAEVQTSTLSSDSALDVEITLNGLGLPGEEANWTGPMGETYNAQVVPEFGTIAAMILAVAIISIVAFSAKSRLSIVPRY
ncbi:PEFG-CTERM sorting domain-containing protein [Nitrosopumilus sp.]|nr:PEFG-CTERM sorting domain-containing protein [Nitrosopumilus sp.]